MDNQEKGTRKHFHGTVVSNKMQKTAVIRVERTFRHPEYQKVITRFKKYYAHVDNKDVEVGQRVKIEETRPLSKLKRWRVVEIIK